MRGVSRVSLAEVTRRFDAVAASAETATLGHELFEVVALLGSEHSLRRLLADASVEGERKAALVGSLLETKVSPATLIVVSDIVQAAWGSARDMVDATERLAVYATVSAMEGEQRLGELEDELFRFGRIVQAQPELRAALTSAQAGIEHKRTLVENLLSGKVGAATLRLVTEAVTRPRGRTLEQGLDHFGKLIADRAQRWTAVVRSAVPLTEAQQERLRGILSRMYGRAIHLNTEVAPDVLGGMSIQVGDEVVDGTVAGRIAEVRRRLAG